MSTRTHLILLICIALATTAGLFIVVAITDNMYTDVMRKSKKGGLSLFYKRHRETQ